MRSGTHYNNMLTATMFLSKAHLMWRHFSEKQRQLLCQVGTNVICISLLVTRYQRHPQGCEKPKHWLQTDMTGEQGGGARPAWVWQLCPRQMAPVASTPVACLLPAPLWYLQAKSYKLCTAKCGVEAKRVLIPLVLSNHRVATYTLRHPIPQCSIHICTHGNSNKHHYMTIKDYMTT